MCQQTYSEGDSVNTCENMLPLKLTFPKTLCVFATAVACLATQAGESPYTVDQADAKSLAAHGSNWMANTRFGMFIHLNPRHL
jgi:hypothetical protein